MPSVKWSRQSLEDLKEIYRYITVDSPHYARIFNDRIFEMVEHLETFPGMGSRVRESNDAAVKQVYL